MVGHVLAVQSNDRVIDDGRKAPNMVGVDMDNLLPSRPRLRQNEPDHFEQAQKTPAVFCRGSLLGA